MDLYSASGETCSNADLCRRKYTHPISRRNDQSEWLHAGVISPILPIGSPFAIKDAC